MSDLPEKFPKTCRGCGKPLDFRTFVVDKTAPTGIRAIPPRHEDLHGTVIACGNCGVRHGLCP